jgi:prepilin-type N-terminal cleavage/methylation domain-containing protein
MPNPRPSRAFTLIELLVVIAIIAILAAILFPVFAQVKARAQMTQGMSNVRNLGLAMQLYMNDADDLYCLAAYQSGETTLLWHDILDPYVKNKQIWLCPGSRLKPTDANGAPTSHFGYNVGYLTDFQQDFSNASGHTGYSASAVAAPSETLVFVSAITSVPNSWCGDDGKLLLPASWPDGDCWGRPDPINFEQTIIAWADTHANQKRRSQFYDNQTPVDRYLDRE